MNLLTAAAIAANMFGNFLNLVDERKQKSKKIGAFTKRNSRRPTVKLKAKARRKMARLSRRKNRAA